MLRSRRSCRRSRSVAVVGLLSLAGLQLASCQLPDVAGFAESAATLRSGLDQAQAVYEPFVATNLSTPQQQAFQTNWVKFEGSADALVAYAQSLAAIVAAGETGAEGAQELATSINSLMNRVGAAGIPSGQVTSVISQVWGFAATGIAASQLADATGQAHPYVDAICRILAEDVADNLADDFDTIYTQVISDIDSQYPDVSGSWDLLTAKRGQLTQGLATAAGPPSQWAAADVQNLKDLDDMLERLRPRAEEWQAAVKRAERLRDRQKQLMRQIGTTARALSAEHGSLKAAIEANKSVSLNNVERAAGKLAELVEKIEEIKSDG